MRFGSRAFDFDGMSIELGEIPIESPATTTDFIFAYCINTNRLFLIILV